MSRQKHITTGMTALILAIGVYLAGFTNAEAVSSTVTMTVKNLSVSSAGTYTVGGGSIIADDGGINCGADCTEVYAKDQTIVLRATPSAGYKFRGWLYNPCPEGLTSLVCTVTLSDPYGSGSAAYTAQWEATSLQVTVQKSGTGDGTVTGSGMNCGAVCSVMVEDGATVSFIATPAKGSKFVGWVSGALSVCAIGGGKASTSTNTSSTCSVTIDASYGGAILRPQFDSLPSTATTAPTSTTTSQPPTPTVDPTKPSLSEPVKELTFNSKAYIADQKPSVPKGKPLVLAGKTFANGTIELTIHSTPRIATVAADANGTWSYTVNGLEVGDHRVEAKVTDPATGKTSEVMLVASFSVMPLSVADAKTIPHATAGSSKRDSPWYIAGVIAVVVIALAGGVLWYMRRKKTSHITPASAPTIPGNTTSVSK